VESADPIRAVVAWLIAGSPARSKTGIEERAGG